MEQHLKVGVIGEDVAARYLRSRGYTILERNYRKKWGELDIVALRAKVLTFVEVKTVSCEIKTAAIALDGDFFKPEDNIHPLKQKRLMRVIQSYLMEHEAEDWGFDAVAVFLDLGQKLAHVRHTKNIVM